MSVIIKCTCGKQFGVMERQLGKKGRCPQCGELILLQAAGGSTHDAAKKKPATGSSPEKDKSAPAKTPAAAKSTPAPEKPAPRPEKAPASAKAPVPVAAKPKVSLDDLISVRSGAAPVKASGEIDTSSQMAGIRHIVQRFCPTCGARYNEGQARCSNCHAPLSAEEIAAAEASKKPPLIPWLPQIYLSGRAKVAVGLLILALIGGIVYACMYPALSRRSRVQAELNLVENYLTTKSLSNPDPMLTLILDMPEFPWHRPASVKALGKWPRRIGASVFELVGKGTYDLTTHELFLTSNDGLKYRMTTPPALNLAARAGDASLVKKLLGDPNCNVEEKDADGDTALHAAAGAPNDPVDVVFLLLDHGAIKSTVDDRGLTPAAIARAARNSRAVRALGGGPALEPRP